MRHLFVHKRPQAAVALFFFALLLMGLFTTGSYGHAWDDLSEMNILRMALKEYDSFLPFDTAYSQVLSGMDIPPISESVERDHGICLYYPLFWAVLNPVFSIRQLSLIWRAYTWGLFMLGLWAVYAIARRMGFSRMLSCACVLMMVLSPRFFAEGHYNNKDIPLLVLVLVLLWQTARLMEKPSFGRGACFALAAGLCAGTRVIGAAFCGLFGLMLIAHLWTARRLNRHAIGVGAFVLLASLGFYILFTPSFLSDPAGFVQYLLSNAVGFSRWHGHILFFGNLIPCASMRPPRLYLPTFMAITTPLWALALLFVGCGFILCRSVKLRMRVLHDAQSLLPLTALLGWVLPLAACIALRTLVYNGWRHVYFLYGPMVLCMGYGLHCLWQHAGKARALLAVIVTGCMLFTAVGIVLNHPYQYAYYNALVPAENRETQFEHDWWNLSCTNALRELLKQTDGPVVIKASDPLTRTGMNLATGYLNADDLLAYEQDVHGQPAQYLIANLGYAAIAGFEPDESMKPIITVSAYGAPITVIYELEGSETP